MEFLKRLLSSDERKRSEATLEGSLLNLAHDAILVLDSQSQIVFWSRGAEDTYGWPASEAIGRISYELLQTRFPIQLEEIYSLLMKLGEWEGELRHVTRDGRAIVVASRWSLQRDEKGERRGVLQINRDITERKLAEDALSTVSQRLIEAHEEERCWIARELHDDINQRLAMVVLLLDGLRQSLPAPAAEFRQEVEKACQELEHLGNDIQALSHRLHSPALELLGIETAAAGFCREFSNRQHAEVAFNSENVPDDLPKHISLCFFRVLQEGVQNAVKHSGSRQVRVSLRGGLNEIQLTVHDSGIGFDVKEATKGLGLTSMRERLKLVNGELSIDSKPQGGTTIHARVPLGPQKEARIGQPEISKPLTDSN